MFTKKIYHCWCHVCGEEFEYESEFLSTGTSKVMPDGTEREVCTCNLVLPGFHSPDEIKDSFWNGYKAERK